MIVRRIPMAGTVPQITPQFPMSGETALLRIHVGADVCQDQADQHEDRPANTVVWFSCISHDVTFSVMGGFIQAQIVSFEGVIS